MDLIKTQPQIGILHLGLGAFHRAHQADFTQDAINASGGNWSIEAVSMRNAKLAHALAANGHVYTLVVQGAQGPTHKNIAAIQSTLALPDDIEKVLARFANENLHIITLTVTEKGYCCQPGGRQLDLTHPTIAHDLDNPNKPKSAIGVLVAGLARRHRSGLPGLSVLSCDNLPDNGDLLRSLVLQLCEHSHKESFKWIKTACTFPNSMVDRITPATTTRTLKTVENLTKRHDPCAVETEPFRQWVIEDRFAGPYPDWTSAGAQIVEDIAPFENMKLRMLNGSHSLIAYLGVIRELNYVKDVMADEALNAIVTSHMQRAAETLSRLPTISYQDYAIALKGRFENPNIKHECRQIAADGSQKMPQRILTPACEQLNAGRDINTFALAYAAWLTFIAREGNNLQDPLAQHFAEIHAKSGDPVEHIYDAVSNTFGTAHLTLLHNDDWKSRVFHYQDALSQKQPLTV